MGTNKKNKMRHMLHAKSEKNLENEVSKIKESLENISGQIIDLRNLVLNRESEEVICNSSDGIKVEESKRQMVDSVSKIYVETNSDEEKENVTKIKEKLQKLVEFIVDGNIADSNQCEWELLCEYRDRNKNISNCTEKSEVLDGGYERVSELEEQIKKLEEEKATELEEQKRKLKEEKATELEEQKRKLEEEKAIELEEQKRKLEEEKATKLEEQKRKLEEEKATELEEQKRKLEEEKATKLEEQKRKLEEEKATGLEEQKRKLEEEKATELEEQKRKSEEEKATGLEEQKRKLEEEKATELEEQKRKLEEEKATGLEEQKRKLEEEKATELEEQKRKLEEEKVCELEEQRKTLNQEREDDLKTQERELREDKAEALEIQKEEFIAQLQRKNNEFQDAVKDYKQLLEYMLECDSLKTFTSNTLGIESADNLTIRDALVLANTVGQEFAFARKIYGELSKYKSVNLQLLTTEEKRLIRAINDYYKKIYKDEKYQSFDVLDCLGLCEAEKVEFDRKSMKDLMNPRNTDLVDAIGIYVPALRRDNGVDFEEKALIKGD